MKAEWQRMHDVAALEGREVEEAEQQALIDSWDTEQAAAVQSITRTKAPSRPVRTCRPLCVARPTMRVDLLDIL